MDTNCNKVVYINRGEHGDPHELPVEQHLEGSTDTEHTLYLHTINIPLRVDSFKNLSIFIITFKTMKRPTN